jgi:hypothetical protein
VLSLKSTSLAEVNSHRPGVKYDLQMAEFFHARRLAGRSSPPRASPARRCHRAGTPRSVAGQGGHCMSLSLCSNCALFRPGDVLRPKRRCAPTASQQAAGPYPRPSVDRAVGQDCIGTHRLGRSGALALVVSTAPRWLSGRAGTLLPNRSLHITSPKNEPEPKHVQGTDHGHRIGTGAR